MDNSLSGRRRPARQTTEKVILYACILAGRPWCALARCRLCVASWPVPVTSASFFVWRVVFAHKNFLLLIIVDYS